MNSYENKFISGNITTSYSHHLPRFLIIEKTYKIKNPKATIREYKNFNSEAFQFETFFNLIQDGPFWGCSRMRGGKKKSPLPKIRHTYPTMMKLSTAITYLKNTQKMCAAPGVVGGGAPCRVPTWVSCAKNNVALKKIELTFRKFQF